MKIKKTLTTIQKLFVKGNSSIEFTVQSWPGRVYLIVAICQIEVNIEIEKNNEDMENLHIRIYYYWKIYIQLSKIDVLPCMLFTESKNTNVKTVNNNEYNQDYWNL